MDDILKTPYERRKEERNRNICSDFSAWAASNPEAKPNRVFMALGEKYGMSIMGIKKIVKQNGLLTNVKRTKTSES